MSNRPVIDWDRVPQKFAHLRQLYEAGYGTWTVNQTPDNEPMIIMYGLTLEEYEAMGPEERVRLGVEDDYQYMLAHQPT